MKQIINELSKEVTELKDRGEIGLFAELKLQNIINKLKKAINYTHCCEELKDLDNDNFEDWIIVNGYAVYDDYYLKNDIAFSESDLIEIYNKEVINL